LLVAKNIDKKIDQYIETEIFLNSWNWNALIIVTIINISVVFNDIEIYVRE